MRIAVLLGGTSEEREVSLASGMAIVRALRERGHYVDAIDTSRGFIPPEEEAGLLPEGVHSAPPEELDDLLTPVALTALPQLHEAEVAFLALHGGVGEDGTLQALLDLEGIRYTGSGPLGSAIAMDKDVTKRLLRDGDVPTLPWRVARAPTFAYDAGEIAESVRYPCIVKPSRQGSSVGLAVVEDAEQLAAAVTEASRYDTEVLIERFARGRELTVGVMGGETFAAVEIRPRKGIYDYESKYTPGMTEYLCPAPLDPPAAERLREYALRAFEVLKLRGYARIDFILADDQLYCLEANTLPGMTATSLLPKGAAAAGVTFGELCERIARLALEDG